MNQVRIILTSKASPVSDFEAESWVSNKINECINNTNGTIEILISNILILNLLRAKYHKDHRELIPITTWWYEDKQVHMDSYMRSIDLWKYPVTCLEENALFTLLEPEHNPKHKK